MSEAEGSARGKVAEWFRWEVAVVTLDSFIAVIFVLWFSVYLPTYQIEVSWAVFVFGAWLFWLTVVLISKAALAVLAERTQILAAPGGTFRISNPLPVELPSITGHIDVRKL